MKMKSVVVIATTQLHSTKSPLRLYPDSNPARFAMGGISENGPLLEIGPEVFRRSIIPQKQFINLSRKR